MNPQNPHPLYAAINAKLAEIAASTPTPTAWYDAWKALGPDSTEDQRLKVYQAIRDSAVLPEDAGFYLVA